MQANETMHGSEIKKASQRHIVHIGPIQQRKDPSNNDDEEDRELGMWEGERDIRDLPSVVVAADECEEKEREREKEREGGEGGGRTKIGETFPNDLWAR